MPDWPLIVTWIVMIGMGTAMGLLVAWPMAILMDSVLGQTAHPTWVHRAFLAVLPASKTGQIIGLAAVGLVLKMSQDLLGNATTVVCNQINYSGLMRIRCELYRKLQSLNLAYHRSQPQGDALYRLSTDTFGCQTILNVLVSTGVAAVTLLSMAWSLTSRNTMLTLLAFSIAPLLAVTNVIFGRRFRRRTMECKEQETRFTTAMQRAMSAITLVQAFTREEEEFGRFRNTIRETIATWWRMNWEQMAYNLIVGFLYGLGGAIIFGYGGYLVSQGRLSIGDLMIYTSYLGMIWGPLCQLTGFATNIQGGVCGAQRVFEVLDRDPVISDVPKAMALPRRPRLLELDNVSFRYAPGERAVLRDVSLRIKPGEMVAFVGASGVGKTTLLNLLPRFHDPQMGAVKLGGVDIRQVRVRDLRQQVALVLQDSMLLPTTVAENIAYGRPEATRRQIVHAAKLAGAHEFIEQLPQGYDSPIAEGGANLSGGQRQRISIARALLTEAPFIILDEPTSAVDPHHERLIMQTLESLRGQRTIIVVSHRLSTITSCDQIFVMENGEVVERGGHSQLLACEGVYWDMAKAQQSLEVEVGRAA